MEDPSRTNDEQTYESWRDARHASMPSTDRRVLEDAVRRATGETDVDWQRIVGGETNEVYVASLPSGDELIVRASRRGAACRFESERWAVSAAASVGVPVPTILLVERTSDEAGELALCVERRLAGHGISEVDDPVERRRLTALAGEVTARLHTIEMTACGWVRPDGTAPAPSWERVMHLGASPDELDALCAQASEHDISPVWVRAAADELDRHDELLAPITPRLLHGDLSPNHVLTDGEQITGLLDFEQAFAGDPAFELVRWDYFYEMAPVAWFLEGYERVSDLGPDAALRIRLGRLRLHLAVIDFYDRMGHTIALSACASGSPRTPPGSAFLARQPRAASITSVAATPQLPCQQERQPLERTAHRVGQHRIRRVTAQRGLGHHGLDALADLPPGREEAGHVLAHLVQEVGHLHDPFGDVRSAETRTDAQVHCHWVDVGDDRVPARPHDTGELGQPR